MGSRNPDRISIVARRPAGETVEAMIAASWEVQARCSTCRLSTAVDLFLVASTRGPETSLWDRDVHCRRRGCKGRMRFYAKAPGMADYDMLAGEPAAREPAYLRGRADPVCERCGKPISAPHVECLRQWNAETAWSAGYWRLYYPDVVGTDWPEDDDASQEARRPGAGAAED